MGSAPAQAGAGRGRRDNDFGGGGFMAPDRDAAQGSAARPGQATRLPNAADSERQLRSVMDTVPEDIRVGPAGRRSLPAAALVCVGPCRGRPFKDTTDLLRSNLPYATVVLGQALPANESVQHPT